MAGHLDLVDPDAARAAFGIGGAQPRVVFTAAIHQAFEPCCQVFDLTPHGSRVSVWRIGGRTRKTRSESVTCDYVRGTRLVGFDERVFPVGLARRLSRSVKVLMSSGASKARFLRPTFTWARTPASTSRVIAWFVA
jgi:hypothetical protein